MRIFILSILLIVSGVGLIQAQTANGGAAISGSIKDPQGANVPGATVRLYGRNRSFSLVTVTDSGGAYSFKNLAAGELRFFGYVDNLFDRDYFESGFRTPGRTGRVGASFVF